MNQDNGSPYHGNFLNYRPGGPAIASPPPAHQIPSSIPSSKTTSHISPTIPLKFSYTVILMLSLFPPLAILLVFGGKPTLLAFCFGTLTVYIFDLLGSVEGSLFSVTIALFAVWGTLIYAARHLIAESLLNLSMIFVMGAILMAVFFIVLGNFQSIVQDFSSYIGFVEAFLFSLIPMLSAVVITWCICVEIPSLDIAMTFSIVYYTYLSILASPRKSNLRSSSGYILTAPVILLLDIYPIFLSGLISLGAHHAVIFSSYENMLIPLVPMTLSSMLMSICVDDQHPYFKNASFGPDFTHAIELFIEALKLFSGALLICFIQNNPAFDDIKVLVYHRKSIVSYGICIMAFTSALTLFIYRLRNKFLVESDIDDFHGKKSRNNPILLDFSICMGAGVSAYLLASVLNIPRYLAIITLLAGAGLCEYYVFNGTRPANASEFVSVGFASIAIALDIRNFLNQTLASLVLELTWVQDLSIQHLCMAVSVLAGAAIVIPAIGHFIRNHVHGKDIVLLPSDSPAKTSWNSNKGWVNGLPSSTFEVLFQFLAMLITAVELLIREQDWSGDLGVDIEAVYPAYLLLLTGLLLGYTVYHCWSMGLMRISAVWLVWLSQSIKLLHLLGLPSLAAGAVGALVYALLSPFISLYQPDGSIAVISSVFTPLVIPWQIFQAGLSVYWFYKHIAHRAFVLFMSRDPTDLQLITGCITIYSLFLATYSHFYIPTYTMLRSFCMMIGVISAMLASGVISGISIGIDWSSPTIITITHYPTDHAIDSVESLGLQTDSTSSGICLLLSGLILFAATYNILPVKQIPYRLLFLLLFSLTSTEAILGWAYPLQISDSSIIEHGFTGFPFIHTVGLVLLMTSTGLHSTLAKPSEVGERIFLLAIAWIIGGLVYLVISDTTEEMLDGLLFAVLAASNALAIVTSFAHVLRGMQLPNYAITTTATTICAVASVLSVSTAIGLSTLGNKHHEQDYVVPISSMVFLTTRENLFISKTHPAEIAVVVCIMWWIARAVFLVAIDGYGSTVIPPKGFDLDSYGIFKTTSISWHTSSLPAYVIIFNIVAAVLPIPAVALSLFKRKNESEELMFGLALLCLLPLVGSQANCIRFIGGFSTVYASWRCYDLSGRNSKSAAVI